MIITYLENKDFNFDIFDTDIQDAINLLHRAIKENGTEHSQRIEVLDRAIFDAMFFAEPQNKMLKDVSNDIFLKESKINNDGFNTVGVGDEVEVEVSKPKTKDIKNSLFSQNEQKFVDKLINDNYADVKYNKIKLEKLANEFGIKEQNLAKELAELSISFVARVYAHYYNLKGALTPKQRFEKIVKLYETQVNLSHRTSESIMLQQYSTPAPIGYLAGLFCGFDKEGGNYFEPSAGNGLLTIAGNTEDFTVNEIDTVRNRNLSVLGFKKVLKQDASEPFKEFEHKFDAVITNPPFGKTEVVTYGKSDIKSLEQVMSLRALDTMKDNGRCAIIIGGHTEYDKEGRIQSGKNRTYFVYLYKHYNVMDVINISGRHLYSRQGTAFNTRLILIDGRKETPSGFPPLIENPIPMNEINSPTPVNSFDVLWERINKSI
jgi:predicted RNA methylase/cold shock CspA family protein